jgi:Iodothyronine deiodinase
MICQEATHRGLLADFVWTMVYIAEAHALSEWPIRSARFSTTGRPILVPEQPKTVLERCTLARRFCHEYNIPTDFCHVLVDSPEHDDPFGQAYAPWPLRLYIIGGDGTVQWIAQPKNCSYDAAVTEMFHVLEVKKSERSLAS